MAIKTQCEDTAMRYKAYGWGVQTVKSGNDLTALLKAYHKAKIAKDGKPQLIICKTLIGRAKTVHVTIDQKTRKKIPLPAAMRKALNKYQSTAR